MRLAALLVAALPAFLARRDYFGLGSGWVQVADVNGDGIPDMIGNEGGHIEVLLGNGDGTFSTGPSTLSLAA